MPPAAALRELFGQHKLTLVKSVLLMLGAMVSTQIIAFYMPAYAARVLGLPTTSSLLASVVVGITCFLLTSGWLAGGSLWAQTGDLLLAAADAGGDCPQFPVAERRAQPL